MNGDILHRIMWTEASRRYIVKYYPYFTEANTEAESQCSYEGHAINAVKQIRIKMMGVRCEDFQGSAKLALLPFILALLPF